MNISDKIQKNMLKMIPFEAVEVNFERRSFDCPHNGRHAAPLSCHVDG